MVRFGPPVTMADPAGPRIAVRELTSDVTVNDRTIVVVTVVPGVRTNHASVTVAHAVGVMTLDAATVLLTVAALGRTAGVTIGMGFPLTIVHVDADARAGREQMVAMIAVAAATLAPISGTSAALQLTGRRVVRGPGTDHHPRNARPGIPGWSRRFLMRSPVRNSIVRCGARCAL